jgi:hypothetical protein
LARDLQDDDGAVPSLGQTRAWVVSRENDAVPAIRAAVASGTDAHADEAGAWNILRALFSMKRVNHSVEFRATTKRAPTSPGCTAPSSAFIAGESAIFSKPTRTNARGPETTARRKRDAMALGHQRGPRAGNERSRSRLLASGALGMVECPSHIVSRFIAKRASLPVLSPI